MRPPAGPVAAVALLLAASAGGASYASLLDPLRDVVEERYAGLDPWAGRAPADVRALARTLHVLERPRDSLLDDLRYAAPSARWLDRYWPQDAGLQAALAGAFTAVRDAALVERAALLAWMGRTGSDRGEARLGRGILLVDRWMQRGDAAEARADRARCWRKACAEVERTRRALRLDAPRAGPPPFEGVAPDFSLADANPNSATFEAAVSPRDHLGEITAWYFTRFG